MLKKKVLSSDEINEIKRYKKMHNRKSCAFYF